MQILRAQNVAEIKAFVEKSIGSIVLYTTAQIDDLNLEKIRVFVDCDGVNNIQITKTAISLKAFVLACSYGTDAVTSFPPVVNGDDFKTVVVLELAENGALKLGANAKLRIELSELDLGEVYVIDGIEEPYEVDAPFMFEDKRILADTKVIDIKTHNFDLCVIQNTDVITEVEYLYANGRKCTYTPRELKALSQDIDPIAYVQNNGKTQSGFTGMLQLPLMHVEEITIKKVPGTSIDLLFREDLTIDENAN